jgi:hypothetical protein
MGTGQVITDPHLSAVNSWALLLQTLLVVDVARHAGNKSSQEHLMWAAVNGVKLTCVRCATAVYNHRVWHRTLTWTL